METKSAKCVPCSKTREAFCQTVTLKRIDGTKLMLQLKGILTFAKSPAEGTFEMTACDVVGTVAKPCEVTEVE